MNKVARRARQSCRELAVSAGLALALASPAGAAVGGFQLPTSPNQTPTVQGPVVEGVASPRPAASEATPTPASAPAPTPAPARSAIPIQLPSPTPPSATSGGQTIGGRVLQPTQPSTTPTTSTTPIARNRPPAPAAAAATPIPTSTPLPQASEPTAAEPPTLPTALPPPDAPLAQANPAEELPWPWLGGIAVALAGLTAFWFSRRKRSGARAQTAPAIERPSVPAAPEGKATPPEPPARVVAVESLPGDDALGLAIEARQLSISLATATLTYRIALINRSDAPMAGLTISGDLVSAHASLSRAEQIASKASHLPSIHRIGRLNADASAHATGEFRVPLPALRPIRQGDMVLFVPLVRLRIEGSDGLAEPICRTLLIGQPPTQSGAGLQPFRLDLGPRIYKDVTLRIFS